MNIMSELIILVAHTRLICFQVFEFTKKGGQHACDYNVLMMSDEIYLNDKFSDEIE